MKRVLVVEDEHVFREQVCKLLVREGWEVTAASSVRAAQAALAARPFDVLLLDVVLPDANGTELIHLRGRARVIMMSAYGTIDSAVDAMRLGAVDYITKPLRHDDLLVRLARAAPSPVGTIDGIVGESAAIKAALGELRRIAATNLTILVLGDTGTGKELVAKAAHRHSPRHKGPFVAFNCAAFADALLDSELFGHERGAHSEAHEAREGLFESANGGTVFLDEVGDLPLAAQSRLLRVLEAREVRRLGANKPRAVDVRVVAATNQDLAAMEEQKTFRGDLIHRLRGSLIRLPLLRDRGDDLFLIADHILQGACAEHGRSRISLSESARRVMREHTWPGNVRELKNTLVRAVVLCDGDEIDASLMDTKWREWPPKDDEDPSLDGYVRRFVRKNQNRLTRKEIAALLGISVVTLWRWCKRLGIDAPPT